MKSEEELRVEQNKAKTEAEVKSTMEANQSQLKQNSPNPLSNMVSKASEALSNLTGGNSTDDLREDIQEIEKKRNEEINKKNQEIMKKDDEIKKKEQEIRAKAAQTTTKSPVTGEQVPVGHVIPGHTGGLNPTIDKIREEQEQTRQTEDAKRVKIAHQPTNPMVNSTSPSTQPQPSVTIGKGAFEQKTIENVRSHNWQTEDGLPPRFIGGSLTPVNAKKKDEPAGTPQVLIP